MLYSLMADRAEQQLGNWTQGDLPKLDYKSFSGGAYIGYAQCNK